MTADGPNTLRLEDVAVVYNGAMLALDGVSFAVQPGRVVALLGANGAGKTTTLRAISGLLDDARGAVSRGRITWDGRSIVGTRAADLVASGLVQVLEGRHCFAQLTVEENLLCGGYVRRLSARRQREALERVYDLFPRLRERRGSRAGLTSGGEQQMVAIGRALMTQPRLVLLDEPSMGLAPRIVHAIFEIVRNLNRDHGITFLVAEQSAAVALRFADQACVLEGGRVARYGDAADLLAWDGMREVYLGGHADPPQAQLA